MTDEAMSPLRRRMIEDMTIRKFAPKSQHDYVQRVKNFAAFLGRSPDTASFEDVRRYQLHLAASGVGVSTLNQTVSTLRFFFKVTLRRHDIVEHTHVIHEPRKLPVVLSPEEVARLLDAAPGLKYKAALSVAYGAGLRAAEVVSLKVSDIDSKRMIIRVEQGKGGKDRNVMLSPHLLDLLRTWWRVARPRGCTAACPGCANNGLMHRSKSPRHSISSSTRASSVASTSKPSALGRAAHSVASPVSDLLPEIAIVREPSQRLVVAGRYDPGQQQPENQVRKRGAKTRIEVERIEIVPHPEFRFVAETRASKPLVTVGDRPVHHVANGVVVEMEVEGDGIVQTDILPEKTVAFRPYRG
jgi:site-specific recombinase XerD